MELVTINNKTELITDINNALEYVEKACGRELADCIHDMHKSALKKQEDDFPYCYTQDDLDISNEYYVAKLIEITEAIEELQDYLKSAKRLNRDKIQEKLRGIHDVSYDY
jgi:hypothetical protein